MNKILLDLITDFIPNDTDALELYDKLIAFGEDVIGPDQPVKGSYDVQRNNLRLQQRTRLKGTK